MKSLARQERRSGRVPPTKFGACRTFPLLIVVLALIVPAVLSQSISEGQVTREELKYSDDEDYNDLGSGSGSGDEEGSGEGHYYNGNEVTTTSKNDTTSPTTSPRPIYFRMTINITSIPYEPALSERSNPEFQRLSRDIILAIEALYSSTPGQQHVTVLKFQPGSVIATIDLGSLGYYDDEELKNVISRAIQRGFIGKYRVTDRGFTFRPFGESPEPIPSPLPGICRSDQFQCASTGRCLEPYQRCNKNFDCADGSDEDNCPDDKGSKICRSDQVLCDGSRCIDSRQRCDGRLDCIDQSDEANCPTTSTPEPTGCASDEFQCKSGKCIKFVHRCNIVPDCPDGDDESLCPECPDNAFRCRRDGRCILDSLVCNEVNDCEDGSDEFNCPCRSNQFECGNGFCINITRRCDGYNDCQDSSDEKDCPGRCSNNEFSCQDGSCISDTLRCNRKFDCPDGSDESDCGLCEPDQFRCNDGTCISLQSRCNGFAECLDSSDEKDCPKCKDTEFTCETDGKCINADLRCNRDYDCIDGSDEKGCTTTPITCAPEQFTCSNGKCINEGKRCNGILDCQDGSDETDCVKTCSANEHTCNDGACIDSRRKCDGRPDCRDGSDEVNCVTTCSSNEHTCDDGTCIDSRRKCDGRPDCRDGSDELNCAPKTCSSNELTCGDGTCVDSRRKCDGNQDCTDGSDEADCGTSRCQPSDIYCDGRCIPVRAQCDGIKHCRDNRDEQNCDATTTTTTPKPTEPTVECSAQEFRCQSESRCIPNTQRCDGVAQCSDNSDELNCGEVPKPTCPDDMFTCPDDSTCLNRNKVCDGNRDCPGGQDEKDCECQSNEFRCGDGRCIDNRRRCDNRPDCTDGSDEENCKPECTSSQFRCSDGNCIDLTRRCDRNYDCSDYSDERDCTSYRCRSNEYTCSDGQCVIGSARCNGRTECSDSSDERDCETIECRVSQFRCLTGSCIDRTSLCDGTIDCPDGSDESSCSRPSGDHNIRVYPERQRIKQTREVVFRCRDEGSNRSPVKWSRPDNTPLPAGATDNNGRLTIPNIKLEHSGVYICSAVGATAGSSGSSRIANLIVEPYAIPTPRPKGVCARNEATCQNGECIPREYVCDEDYDCTDRSDEFNCGRAQKCEPNEYQCDNGNCIGKYWRCDGENDCGDNSDERNCEPSVPGSACRYFEYKCTSGNQCIPRSFQCDGDIDCQDGTDEIGCAPPTVIEPPVDTKVVTVGETVIITCVAIGTPTPIISWRLNWGHIPDTPRITVETKDGRGVLTIRDAQDTDQGAYTCEAINIKDRIIAQPDCILVVKTTPGICTSPYFNSNARSPAECLRCHCFGLSQTCQSSNLKMTPKPLGRNVVIVGLTRTPSGEFTPFRGQATKPSFDSSSRSYRIGGGAPIKNATRDTNYFWSLPSPFLGNQLNSYGGYMRYTIRYRPGSQPQPVQLPDIIIVSNSITLYHYARSKINPQTDNRIEAWLYEGQWQKSPSQDPSIVATTSRQDIMHALQNVTAIYVRASYDRELVESTFNDFSLDVAESNGADSAARAIYVEECDCPEGYEGSSCERCSSGYIRKSSGRDLGRCVKKPTCNCHQHTDICNPRSGECINCRHNTEGRRCERCVRGYYGDARVGTSDDCKPCPCPLTIPANQFSPSCFLDNDDEVTCDACPPGYEGRRCERCAPNYAGNPLVVNDYCKPNTSRCDRIGSASPNPDPRTGRCRCKPHVTGPRCDQCAPNTFYLNPIAPNGCLDCFCSGITRACSSSTLNRKQVYTTFSGDRHGFTLSDLRRTYQTDRGLQVDSSSGELQFSQFTSQPQQAYYWQLPASYLGNKLTSYGGFLNFTISFSARFSAQSSRDPDIQIVGNDIVLVYRFRDQPVPNTSNRLSIPLYETLWQRLDGGEANREHMLMALADLEAVLIKATYGQEPRAASIRDISLDIAEDGITGQDRAYAVEQCQCPPGYTGLSCENCDSGYTRSGGGLYLGLCDPCSCNGHSTECHPSTGICRNCQHNTAGDTCERCAPGYTGDATRGATGDCRPNSEPSCRCNVSGSTSKECDFRNQCSCKKSVEGANCDRCKPGHFMLNAENPDGCSSCFCFGVTKQCSAGTFYKSQVSMDLRDSGSNDFSLSDRYNSEQITDGIRSDVSRREVQYRGFAQLSTRSPLYWSLPPQFLGNKLTSYGGKLQFSLRYTASDVGSSFSDADIQITGNGRKILYVNSQQVEPNKEYAFIVDITEKEWQVVDTDGPRQATREDFMMILANVESLLIRASYHTNMEASYLSQVGLDIALPSQTNRGVVESVEQCRCPSGYSGSSCEDCAPGYSRDRSAGRYLGRCIRCNCNGHAESCDSNTGQCVGCRHNTVGAQCEKCADGFYGDPRQGTADDCKPCPCPLPIPSNKFSSTCYVASDGRPTCDSCFPGYTGRNCGSCIDGYVGNPTQPGDRCILPGQSQRIQVVVDEPKVSTIPIGGTAVFRCSGRTQGNDVSYTLSWSKENGELSSRCTDINGELTIRNAQLEDAGTYICSGSDLVSVDQEQAVLIVQGSRIPTPPRVKIEPHFLQLKEGEPAEFKCTADGFPTPELRWTGGRDGLNPTSSFENGIFRIPSVRKSDEAEYYCTASNSLGSDKLRTIILVSNDDRNRVSKPTVSVNRPVYDARPGETVRLTCQSEGRPTPVISWTRAGRQPLPANATVIGGTVNIINVDERHSGVYICTATNTEGSARVEIRLTVLTGTGDQPPTARIDPEKLVIGKNSDAEMKCYVTGSPSPRVSWSKVGNDLSSRAQVSGDTLIIRNALDSDQGTYLCYAKNDVGNAQAASYLYIQGREPPSIEIYPQAEQSVPRGGSALFQCRVTQGIPSPTVKWTRSNQRSLTDRTEILSGGVIKFNRVTDDEQGIYVCTAENVAGKVTAEVSIQIIGAPSVSIQPSSPYIVKEGDRARMLCTAIGDPVPNIVWKRQIRSRLSPLGFEELTLKERRGLVTLEIDRVTRLDAGIYICSATNNAGPSQKSIELKVSNSSVVPGVNVQKQLVTASIGSRAELRCSVVGEEANIQLKWVRTDGLRMPLDVQIQGGILIIDNVDLKDGGEYSCIGYLDGRELFRQDAHIAVIAPPRITLNPVRQVVRPGDNVRIQCSATGDQPITIDWRRLRGPLARHVTDRNGVLEFRGIKVNDAGRYICTAVNSAGRAEAPAEVAVNEETVGQLTKTETVYVGSNIELKCQIPGADPQYNRWAKDDGQLASNAQVIDGELWIRSVTRENEGRYICQAVTSVGTGRQYTLLNVRAVPTLMVKIKPSKKMVHMGNDLDLRCMVEGDSSAQVTWTKLESNDSLPENVQVYGKVLSIRGVKGQNGGIYRCSIDSFAGVFNDDYVLAIQETPTIPPGEVETRQAPFGSTVVMDCQKKLAGRAAYTWSKQGGSLPPQHKVTDSEITISNVRADDAGIYICTIKTNDMTVDVPTILVVTGVVPYFAQAPLSYLSLPTLPAYVEFDIEASFKPDKPDGLILYNGQQDGSGDYIAFGLADGHAEFRFELGSGPAVVRSAEPLPLGEWHTVRMSRNGKEGRLQVDDEPEVKAIAQGQFKGLDLLEPLFVGGTPDFSRIGKQSGFTQGFVGCIGRLMIGGVEHDLINDAETTLGVTSCETCSNSPCRHGGVCQESLSKRGYECICAAGFSGENCEKVGEACYPGVCGEGRCINKPGGFDCYCPFGKTGPRCEKEVIILEPAFGDDSFAAYTAPRDAIRRLKVKMKFKVKEIKDGIIMYCAQNEDGQGDFVAMAIKDQCLEFRFDTGSGPAILRSPRKLVPEEWVDVQAERTLQEGSLILNDDVAVKGRSPGRTRGLNLLTSLYIGGYDDNRIAVSPFVEVKNGFNGCISKVQVNDVDIDLVSAIIDASNVADCTGQRGCESKPCRNDGVCVQLAGGDVDYTCICGQGFSGRHCELEENICDNIQPCLNGGTCISNGSTYKCNCPLGYGGGDCDKDAMFDKKARFQSDSYLEFDRQLLPHTSTIKETIKVSFETSASHGVLFFHGQKPDSDGKGRDYLVIALVDGYLTFSYELGSGSAEIRSREKVNDGKMHTVILERTGQDGSMTLDGTDKVIGSSQGMLEMLNTEGNIFIGGVPNHEKMTADQYPKGWSGCIYDLEIQDSGVIDLFMNARRGTNVLPCNGFTDGPSDKEFFNRAG